jgi:nucleotide-binding universal stress UspA family protein
MKNILVPTDFSDCARTAEDIGLDIAKKANAEIHFIHLLTTPIDWTKISLEKEKLFPEIKAKIGFARNELSKLKIRAEKLGLKAKDFLVFNNEGNEIYEHIKHHKHDFIVMGSRGTKGIREIIGSNTQKVVRYSLAPVLIVKQNPKIFKVKEIVFASTFDNDTYKPFLKIREFANLMNARLHLLYVNTPYHFKETDEIERNILAILKKYPVKTFTINIYNAFNEERGIQNFVEIVKADVIALATHGRTGLMKMVAPSITENIAIHFDLPVLSVNMHHNGK